MVLMGNDVRVGVFRDYHQAVCIPGVACIRIHPSPEHYQNTRVAPHVLLSVNTEH